jgi:hypothetical protein
MPDTPEARARQNIDQLLTEASWIVQSREDANLAAGRGIAIREFPMKPGFGEADYLLYVDTQAVGVVEAKKEGSTLTGFEIQTAKYSDGLPPLAEQEVIVEALADQVSVIEHLEKELQGKLGKAEALRQSMLKSAFQGKLVPQNPTDEPASILLARLDSKFSSEPLTAVPSSRMKAEVLSMPRNKEKRRISIVEALRSTKSGMSPETLLSATGHEADSIDEFYAELKAQVESGLVEEIRSGDKIAIRASQK